MEVKSKHNLEKHLTEGKFYRVIDRTDKEFTIINDSKVKYSYPRKAFETTAESQTKIVNPNTIDISMPGSNAMWVASETPIINEDYKKWVSAISNPSTVLKVVYTNSDVAPTTDESINNGGSTDYYKMKPEWKDLQDLIEERGLSYSQANILKCAFTFNVGRHGGTDAIRDLNKIIYFAQRELNRLKK